MDEQAPATAEAVLVALMDRLSYDSWAPLLKVSYFPEHLRPYYEALVTYYEEIDPGGDRGPTGNELQALVGASPNVNIPLQDPLHSPATAYLIRNWVADAGARELGALALDWSVAKPAKRSEIREKIQAVAQSVASLDEVINRRENVTPTSVGTVTDLSEQLVDRVPFGFLASLDQATGGGAPVGKLGAIMAPLGVGKTLSLTNYGAAASRAGIPVYHFTLEMDQLTITKWYYSILTGIPYAELGSREMEALAGWKDEWGEIKIFDFSGRYCSVGTIEQTVRTVGNTVEERSPNTGLCLVDYLALCDRSTDDLYGSLGAEARRLRKLAVQRNLAVVTGVQANRAAMFGRGPNDRPRTEIHHTADSLEIPRVMDWILMLSQDSMEKTTGRMRAELGKNRMGYDNAMLNLVVDYPRLRMTEHGNETYWDQ